MRPQLNRLPETTAGALSGSAIDRTRPLRFRLDGRLISGFAGDTVLSAVLASGIDTLGLYRERPLGLTPSASPVIFLAGRSGDAAQAMPMACAPAMNDAEFVTLGAQRTNPLARLFLPGRTLGLDLGEREVLDRPWRHAAATPHEAGNLVVIGGGVAGMEAALAASRRGLAVTLVEASPVLGGHSGLFGTQDGEMPPESEMARLRHAIEANDGINVLLRAHAFAIQPGCVRVHLVDVEQGKAEGKVLDLRTRYIVLATGSQERLPVFSGNRLPGVMGTLDSYLLAARYGVWPGQSALVATASSFGYRLAMLASDAGIDIKRVLDSRDRANSRFIEFSRAYGMIQMLGVQPQGVGTTKAGTSIAVHTGRADAEALLTERLLVCGGWQPDLTLWHAAGGASQWQPRHNRLEAGGTLNGIVLAGAAAGYLTRRGCIESGSDAINILLNRKRKPVSDTLIDPLYESPDSALPVAAQGDGAAPSFLDGGQTFMLRPTIPQRRWTDIFRRVPPTLSPALSEMPGALAIGEVVAGIALGLIQPEDAGAVARERAALIPLPPIDQSALEEDDDEPAPLEIPPYLGGRFGADAKLVKINPAEPRQFSSGALIHADSDSSGPLDAIGVILRDGEQGTIALMSGETAHDGRTISVRDQGRAIPARVKTIDAA